MANYTSVLMLTCQYMPDVYGGAEKQCHRLSRYLAESDIDVTIITSRQKLAFSASEREESVNVKRIYTGIAPDLLGRWLMFSAYWLLRVLTYGVLNRHKIDIIHCHQGKFGAFVGCLLGKIINKPVLIKVGNSDVYMDLLCLENKKFVGPLMTRFIVNCNPNMVAITAIIKSELQNYGFKRVVTIHNGIDTSLAKQEIKSSVDTKNPTVNLFYHGRLESIKRIDVLIDAFSLVLKKNKQCKLNIIGDGSCLKHAESQAIDNGIADSIVFHGAVADIPGLIKDYDVFVNASSAEGFSNSLLEALLLGKVLVSTPVSGANDAIYVGKNGFISNDFSAQALARAMDEGIGMYQQDHSNVNDFSRNHVDTYFQMNVISKKYKELYVDILKVVA